MILETKNEQGVSEHFLILLPLSPFSPGSTKFYLLFSPSVFIFFFFLKCNNSDLYLSSV